MKIFALLFALFISAHAFVPQLQRAQSNVVLYGYVPDGMTPAQYAALKKKEQAAKAGKKFGAYGPQSFQSRSLQAFQNDLERGKAGHLMPMFNAKEKIKSGKIKQQDIPYMQRGGHWDNSDVKGAKKKAWSSKDKNYNPKEAAVADNLNLDWGFNRPRAGPAQPQNKAAAANPPKKKKGLFGF